MMFFNSDSWSHDPLPFIVLGSGLPSPVFGILGSLKCAVCMSFSLSLRQSKHQARCKLTSSICSLPKDPRQRGRMVHSRMVLELTFSTSWNFCHQAWSSLPKQSILACICGLGQKLELWWSRNVCFAWICPLDQEEDEEVSRFLQWRSHHRINNYRVYWKLIVFDGTQSRALKVKLNFKSNNFALFQCGESFFVLFFFELEWELGSL